MYNGKVATFPSVNTTERVTPARGDLLRLRAAFAYIYIYTVYTFLIRSIVQFKNTGCCPLERQCTFSLIRSAKISYPLFFR